MFDVFGACKGLLKIDKICIDNSIFKLHYKATVLVLVVFSLLVTSKQYIGDPIDCLADSRVPANVIDTYCWIHTTYTLPNKLVGKIGIDMIQPGVGPEGKNDTRIYHKYYQWVCFVLFFQAVLFYAPRYMWKTWEGGRIKMLVLDLNVPIISEQSKTDRKKLLVEYFITNLHKQNFYAFRFFACEAFNFINIISQIYLMDVFLGGQFSTYGHKVLQLTDLEPELRVDPMNIVFPKVTKCDFRKYGSTAGMELIDALCILPLNIVNEKIYVFLWFWFVILAIITCLSLMYRIATVLLPKLRFLLLKSQSALSPVHHIESITKQCNVGDWFVLYQLGKNIDTLIYKELIADLAKRLDGKGEIC